MCVEHQSGVAMPHLSYRSSPCGAHYMARPGVGPAGFRKISMCLTRGQNPSNLNGRPEVYPFYHVLRVFSFGWVSSRIGAMDW